MWLLPDLTLFRVDLYLMKDFYNLLKFILKYIKNALEFGVTELK